MSAPGRLRPSEPQRGLRLWLRPEVAACWAGGLPTEGPELASSGRGSMLRVDSPLGPTLIRTYRRGGLLRGLLPDLFASPGRALAELEAAERLEPLGLAPAVLGLEARGLGPVRLRVAVAEVEGGRDLLRLARASPRGLDDPALGAAVGRAVAAMHEAGVSHPDLNLANVLVDGEGGVRLLDFDGARLHDGPTPEAERRAQVLRLCRSLDKWAPSAATPAASRAAFLRGALDPSARREVLAAGRAQHLRRSRRGRTSRPLAP